VTVENPALLFPMIYPSSASPAANRPQRPPRRPARARHVYDAIPVSEVVPLSLRQAGQVGGLIVLGLAIVLAFVRISLRKPGG